MFPHADPGLMGTASLTSAREAEILAARVEHIHRLSSERHTWLRLRSRASFVVRPLVAAATLLARRRSVKVPMASRMTPAGLTADQQTVTTCPFVEETVRVCYRLDELATSACLRAA